MHGSHGKPISVWIAVGIIMAILTALLIAGMQRDGVNTFVQATVIISLVPLLVFVD